MIRKAGPAPEGQDPLETRKKFLTEKGFYFVEHTFSDTSINAIREQLKGLLMARDYLMFLDEKQRVHLAFHQHLKPEQSAALMELIHAAVVAEDREQSAVSFQMVVNGIIFLQREEYKKTVRRQTPRDRSKPSKLIAELQIFDDLEFEDLKPDSDQI